MNAIHATELTNKQINGKQALNKYKYYYNGYSLKGKLMIDIYR